MRFTPKRATSIDLCAHELVLHSKYLATSQIICAEETDYLPSVAVAPFPAKKSVVERIRSIVQNLRTFKPDVIVVHQHLRSLFLVSLFIRGTPIVFYRHNYLPAKANLASRLVYSWYWSRIAAVVFVSASCRDEFLRHSPYPPERTFVVHNGLNVDDWHPRTNREKEIIYAGRCWPDKGVLEAAGALAQAIADRPDWRATFYIAQPDHQPKYFAEVQRVLAPLGKQARIVTDVPFAEVKSAFERGAIALVPSIWKEPFGRAAIEAMAGGAALITSGRGGLAEIIGRAEEEAAVLAEPDVPHLQAALTRLISDDDRRHRIAAAGHKRVHEHFSITALARVHDDRLAQLVGHHKHQPSQKTVV